MWTRPLLKSNAKRTLKLRYWKCFLACLIAALLGALVTVTNTAGNAAVQVEADRIPMHGGGYIHSNEGLAIFGLVGAVAVIMLLAVTAAAVCFGVFISSPIRVGLKRYMMESRYADSPLETLFSTFRGPSYMNVVKGMFATNIRIFGWSLLCGIPGIWKQLQYSMVPYLLAENPYMSPARARELSAAMTEGEKMNIFVLGLSFIGWNIVASMAGAMATFGLVPSAGMLFLNPYVEATYAELYAALRAKAFSLGITGEEELAGFVRH